MTRIAVTVSLGDKKITIEGPEEFVRGEIDRLARIGLTGGPDGPTGVPSQQSAAKAAASERDLVAAKHPKGHVQTVAVLGYFLKTSGHPEFTPEDVRRAYLRAGVRPPKVISQALRDAKNTADYIERGSKPGTYKLTDHGEATVMFGFPDKPAGLE